jgi:hypothetical protein
MESISFIAVISAALGARAKERVIASMFDAHAKMPMPVPFRNDRRVTAFKAFMMCPPQALSARHAWALRFKRSEGSADLLEGFFQNNLFRFFFGFDSYGFLVHAFLRKVANRLAVVPLRTRSMRAAITKRDTPYVIDEAKRQFTA